MAVPSVEQTFAGTRPRAFVSYSWDSPAHVEWVAALARRLRRDGVEVVWDEAADAGADLAVFMEQATQSDRVIVVCTPSYKKKADSRSGGVGYEVRLLVARLIRDQKNTNVIPLLRQGPWEQAGPRWIGSARYLDFTADPYSESEYLRLVAALGADTPAAPPDIPVPVRPSLKLTPTQTSVMAVLLFLTVYLPMRAGREGAIISTPQEQAEFDRYLVRTGVRAGLVLLLAAVAVVLRRVGYRSGLGAHHFLREIRLALISVALAGSTCFSTMLNLSLTQFQVVPDVPALAWPERLSYIYLAVAFLALAFGFWKVLAVEGRSS
jgi:hypothetical protein